MSNEEIWDLLHMKDDCIDKIRFFREQMSKCREGIELANEIIDKIDSILRREIEL